MVDSEGKHFRSHSLVFYKIFYDDSDDYNSIDFEKTQNIFTLDDL